MPITFSPRTHAVWHAKRADCHFLAPRKLIDESEAKIKVSVVFICLGFCFLAPRARLTNVSWHPSMLSSHLWLLFTVLAHSFTPIFTLT